MNEVTEAAHSIYQVARLFNEETTVEREIIEHLKAAQAAAGSGARGSR